MNKKEFIKGDIRFTKNKVCLIRGDFEKTLEELILFYDNGFNEEKIKEYAKDEKTELYKSFTWSDSIAAEKWRDIEYKNIIKSFNIVVIKVEKAPTTFSIDIEKYNEKEILVLSTPQSIIQDDGIREYKLVNEIFENDNLELKYYDDCIALQEEATKKIKEIKEYKLFKNK